MGKPLSWLTSMWHHHAKAHSHIQDRDRCTSFPTMPAAQTDSAALPSAISPPWDRKQDEGLIVWEVEANRVRRQRYIWRVTDCKQGKFVDLWRCWVWEVKLFCSATNLSKGCSVWWVPHLLLSLFLVLKRHKKSSIFLSVKTIYIIAFNWHIQQQFCIL